MVGYSGKPLAAKLGIKPGLRIAVLNPPAGYWQLLELSPDELTREPPGGEGLDLIHIFATGKDQLAERLRASKNRIAANGCIWASWPKRSARVATNLDENSIRALALDVGLVDVKVCAVDDVWSALKLVIPLKHRPKAP